MRKSDDFRSREIDSWDDYVQDELAADMQENDYTNLPERGKPIKIWRTEIDPDNDLAFSRLKNAGVKPAWMELDSEIAALTDRLWAQLDTVEQELREEIVRAQGPAPVAEAPPPDSLWTRLRRWFRQDYTRQDDPPPTFTSIMAERERERSRFLELAAELDTRIRDYHDSLPAGAQHLQRLRWLPERAARVFDERISLTAWWDAPDA